MRGKLSEPHCHVLLFLIPGRRFETQGKLLHRFVPQFFSISWPSPRNCRPTMHCNVVLTVFHTWWCICCVWKIVRTTFQRIVVSQSRGCCSIMWENCMDPGSESATCAFCSIVTIQLQFHIKCFPFAWPSMCRFNWIKTFFSKYTSV